MCRNIRNFVEYNNIVPLCLHLVVPELDTNRGFFFWSKSKELCKMSIFKKILIMRKVIRDSRKIVTDTPFWLNLLYLLRGFTKEKIKLYSLNNSNYKLYLSDFQRRAAASINGIYSPALDNKLFFESLFEDKFSIPKNYFLILRGKLYSLKVNNKTASIEDVLALLKVKKRLVIKPVTGGKGDGVRIISYCDFDDTIILNNTVVSSDGFSDLIRNLDNYIICEFIKQSKYAENLFAGTTNTIRMFFFRNPENNKICLFGATQRMGGENTGGLDNFSSGGAIAEIDLETGILGYVVRVDNNWNMSFSDVHPDSQNRVKGIKIPNWNEIIEDIKTKLNEIPYIKYIGLDVVITDNWYYVIEGNNFPEPRIIQIFKPLLQDPDAAKFFKRHYIL